MRLRPFKFLLGHVLSCLSPLAAARAIAIKSAPRQALNRNDLLAFQHL
jgi:hypothetical protein